MTRFQREITGQLGEYWEKHARQEAADAVTLANDCAVIEKDGAIRWKSNGSYLMDDFCEKLEYMDYPFSRQATGKKRERQVKDRLSRYRPGFSEETLNEMSATFGPDTMVTDIITGEEVVTV